MSRNGDTVLVEGSGGTVWLWRRLHDGNTQRAGLLQGTWYHIQPPVRSSVGEQYLRACARAITNNDAAGRCAQLMRYQSPPVPPGVSGRQVRSINLVAWHIELPPAHAAARLQADAGLPLYTETHAQEHVSTVAVPHLADMQCHVEGRFDTAGSTAALAVNAASTAASCLVLYKTQTHASLVLRLGRLVQQELGLASATATATEHAVRIADVAWATSGLVCFVALSTGVLLRPHLSASACDLTPSTLH